MAKKEDKWALKKKIAKMEYDKAMLEIKVEQIEEAEENASRDLTPAIGFTYDTYEEDG